jgi:acetylornithine deacetylase
MHSRLIIPIVANCESPIKVNVGKIEGGDWVSSVPAWCSFDSRTARYRVEDAKQVAQEPEDFVNETATVHYF